MDPISMLIFNALVRRQSINLPDIGSLKVIVRPPIMEKKGVLTPPSNRVVYAETEFPEFTSIITLIAQSSNKDEAQAWDIYGRWLAGARSENRVIIDSVGEIRDGRFFAANELNEILNPVNPAPVRLTRQMEMRQILVWVIGAVVLGGAISIGAITLLNRSAYSYQDEQMQEIATAQESASVTALANTSSKDSTTETASPDAPFDTPEPGSSQTSDAATTKPTATTPTATASQTAAKTASTAPSATSGIKPGQLGYYVVVGTYSTDANANKFIAKAKQTDSALSYQKLVLNNGKIMVYTAASASEQEANQQKRQCAAAFPDAWIYKHRSR